MKLLVAVATEKIPDLVSWQIMRRLNFEGSHIFVVIEEDDMMFHAADLGVEAVSFSEFCLTHNITKRKEIDILCDKAGFYSWWNNLEKDSQIEYSNWQYVGFVFPWLRKLVRNQRRRAICSEFVGWVLHDLAAMKQFAECDFLTPKDVWEQINDN